MLHPEKKKKNSTARRYRWPALLILALIVLAAGALMLVPKLITRPMQLVFMVSEPEGAGVNRYPAVINADGTGYHDFDFLSHTFDYAWSPDGSRLAFGSTRQTMFSDIYVMNADGSHIVYLTGGIGQETLYRLPAWSPDGTRITFQGENPTTHQSELWTVNSDGSSSNMIDSFPSISGSLYPTWSPDGSTIAYSGEKGALFVMDVHSFKQAQLTHTPGLNTHSAWSPDGSHIVFERWLDTKSDIFVINVDGTNEINLSDYPTVNTDAGWSPDGQKVVFVSTRDEQGDLYIVNADGKNLFQLTKTNRYHEQSPSYSPDGSKIAFYAVNNMKSYIGVIYVDGSNQTVLAEGEYPRWRPNPCGAWDIVCYLTH